MKINSFSILIIIISLHIHRKYFVDSAWRRVTVAIYRGRLFDSVEEEMSVLSEEFQQRKFASDPYPLSYGYVNIFIIVIVVVIIDIVVVLPSPAHRHHRRRRFH